MRKHRTSHRSIGGKNFVILPIIFCVLIIGISTAIVYPSTASFISMAKFFFSDGEKDFSTGYNNIFVPVEEDEDEEKEQTTDERKVIPMSTMKFPSYGDQFGELIIEDCQIEAKLFFNDGANELNNGVGMYTGSSIPGYGKTILVAGHNNTYFNGLKYAKKGQRVKIRTSYGNYIYEINDIQIRDRSEESACNLDADYENLVMYTCYPFDELGLTPQRCFVYAKFISGPALDNKS